MKKNIFIAVIILSVETSNAQNTEVFVPGGILKGSGNSNVGVGTQFPGKEFGVFGDIALEKDNSFLNGKNSIGTYQPLIGISGLNTIIKGRDNHEIKIATGGDGEVHIIGNRIGLGTDNPEKELGIVGNIALQSYNSFLYAKLAQPVGSLQPVIGIEGLNTVIKGRENHEIKIETSGDGEVHLIGNRIGLGTNNPEKELGVVGNIALQSYNSFLYARLAQPVGSLQPVIGIEGLNTVIKGRENHEIKIETSGDGEVHILANKVGIATTTIGSHRLAVEGSIGAREIKVEMTKWEDRVFSDSYELRTLSEVEDYISEYKHLPEIPSEAEVIENGINLGDMNAKLLQKIEELTLYLIEQNEEIKELKEKVQRLENE